jgi:hypothetical protein
LEGPTIELLRRAVTMVPDQPFTKADQERLEELGDFFQESFYTPRFSHAFDHAKKRACP